MPEGGEKLEHGEVYRYRVRIAVPAKDASKNSVTLKTWVGHSIQVEAI